MYDPLEASSRDKSLFRFDTTCLYSMSISLTLASAPEFSHSDVRAHVIATNAEKFPFNVGF